LEELEMLKRQIATAGELQSLVRVMKSLAASRVREYDQAVASIEEYGRTIASGLQVAMKNRPREIAVRPSRRNRIGAIVLGSDQGLCGNFNERIADHAIAKMGELGITAESRAVVVVGERPALYLETAGYALEDRLPFVGDHGAITRVILKVLEKIEEWDIRRRVERIALFYNKPTEGATFQPEMQYLLPLDLAWLQGLGEQKWPGRSIPTFPVDWDSLFAGLVKQHIFFTIYRAFIESMASENTSRLRAMQAAQKNIDQRLDDLHVGYNRMRQSSVTSELLDISTGFQAITGEDTSASHMT
jgi:F-type H+-transporting ATPase subunit gamma